MVKLGIIRAAIRILYWPLASSKMPGPQKNPLLPEGGVFQVSRLTALRGGWYGARISGNRCCIVTIALARNALACFIP
jgi:hypothetical protein